MFIAAMVFVFRERLSQISVKEVYLCLEYIEFELHTSLKMYHVHQGEKSHQEKIIIQQGKDW
jgi:hypothetical protein